MGKPLSMDLRSRALAAVDEGMSCRAAARRFGVAAATVTCLATGHTDMRRGMFGLALQVKQGFKRDPHPDDLYIFRDRRGDLVEVLWHDGVGMSLYAKRLDRGRFIWPAAADGVPAEAIGWLNPRMACSSFSMAAGVVTARQDSHRTNPAGNRPRRYGRAIASGRPLRLNSLERGRD